MPDDPNLDDYLERTDSVSPATARFSLQNAQAVTPYLLTDFPSAQKVTGAIDQILGGIETEAGDGKIARTLPVAHPVFQWLYASNIQSIRGIGNPQMQPAVEELFVQPFPAFASYEVYEFSVEFTPRPYAVLDDTNITVTQLNTWYNDNGTPQSGFSVANEWLRYTDYYTKPIDSTIRANFGTMVFQTASGNRPGFRPPLAGPVQFPAQPNLFLPNQILKFVWFQVPYRWISSNVSFIRSGVGRINQFDWYLWPAGSLLYLNYEPKRYTPPVPEIEPFDGVFSTEKWCDIEFTFLLTTRTGADVPQPNPPGFAQANQNHIAAGHNLQPWLTTRKFYYVYSPNPDAPNDQTQWVPTYKSIPFELLFTDPDIQPEVTP